MKRITIILALFFVVMLTSCSPATSTDELSPYEPPVQTTKVDEPREPPLKQEVPPPAQAGVQDRTPNPIFEISDVELLFTGGYADPSVIKNGEEYLMYLNTFGTPKGVGVYILSSTDLVNWQEETAIVFPGIATARAVRFDEGIRVYYPENGVIKSSLSVDGLTNWQEDNAKITPKPNYKNEGPTVFQLPDNTYRMYFNEYLAASEGHGTIRTGEIYGASSQDGINWVVDKNPTLVFENAIEGRGMQDLPPQVLHPFVIKIQDNYYLFYNAHSEIFVAKSTDGSSWEKLGYTGIHGADVDAVVLADGSLRIYYGDFSPETQGVVYTGILRIQE